MSKYTTPRQVKNINIKEQAVEYAIKYSVDLQIILAEIAERLLAGEIDGIPKFTQEQVKDLFPFDWKNRANVSMLIGRYGRKGSLRDKSTTDDEE